MLESPHGEQLAKLFQNPLINDEFTVETRRLAQTYTKPPLCQLSWTLSVTLIFKLGTRVLRMTHRLHRVSISAKLSVVALTDVLGVFTSVNCSRMAKINTTDVLWIPENNEDARRPEAWRPHLGWKSVSDVCRHIHGSVAVSFRKMAGPGYMTDQWSLWI